MRCLVLALCVVCIATGASAQQAVPDPAFMQKAIAAVQAQRNNALDVAAAAEARATQLAEENTKLKAQIEQLTKPKPEGEPAK